MKGEIDSKRQEERQRRRDRLKKKGRVWGDGGQKKMDRGLKKGTGEGGRSKRE